MFLPRFTAGTVTRSDKMWIWITLIALINTGTILSCPQNCEECLAPDGRSRCTNGYYLDGDQWISCPDQDCKTCRGARQCTRCLEGYYLDGHQCTRCPPQCATCTGSDRCIRCKDGYYLDGHKCTQCSQECATCTGPYICTRCTDGFYLAIHQCTPCPQECAICTGPYICTRCTDGFYQDRHRCTRCPQGCAACTGPYICSRCTYGFYQDRHRCKPICPPGCATCPGSDQCTSCTEGYCLDRHYQCKQCQQGCETFTGPDQCINCTEGYCFNGSKCKECHRCPNNCQTCVQSTTCPTSSSCKPTAYCTSCKAGYFGNHCQPCRNCKNNVCSHGGQCIHGCNDGSYVSTKGCERCPYNCLTCTSPTVCTSCSLGHGSKCDQPCRNCKSNRCSKVGQCTDGCIDKHYQGRSGCVACPNNCHACTSPTLCTVCTHGYHGNTCEQQCRNCKDDVCSHDGKCIRGCQDGFYEITTGCAACPHCLTCISSSLCTSCPHGYYGKQCKQQCRNCKNNTCSIDGQCSDGCVDRHYQGTTGCDPCPANCSSCRSSSFCDHCNPLFHGTTCKQQCPHNCIKCSSDSNCSKCKDGYFGQSCEQACSATCIYGCNKVDGKCSWCSNGYYKMGKHCKMCSNGCAKCRNVNICSECQRGYFREQVSHRVNCFACGHNCGVCESKDSCTTCNQGHVFVNGHCLPCHNCEDVKACSSQSTCPQCLDGFWGQYCGKKCNDTCKRCNQSSGQCTQCTDNTFGRYCELQCSKSCLHVLDNTSTCLQQNGACTYGCVHGFTGPDCTDENQPVTSTNVALVVGPILGGIVVMVAVVIVGIIMWRRRVNRPDLKEAGGGHPSGRRDPRTSTFNPAYDYIDIDPAAEAGHQTTPSGKNVASANHADAFVQKNTPRKPGQPDKTRGHGDGTDNVYNVASVGCSHGGASGLDKSRSQAEGDTYNHINHYSGCRQHGHVHEGAYDHVTHQNIQKGDVDNTYDVTGGQTSSIYHHTVKTAANTSLDGYSTIGNVQ